MKFDFTYGSHLSVFLSSHLHQVLPRILVDIIVQIPTQCTIDITIVIIDNNSSSSNIFPGNRRIRLHILMDLEPIQIKQFLTIHINVVCNG